MKNLLIILFLLFTLKSFTQNVNLNYITNKKELILPSGKKIIGEPIYKISFKDSISSEIGIKELPALKLIFYNESYSYVETIISDQNKNTSKIRHIIRIDNSSIDFNQSKGQSIEFVDGKSIIGFGKFIFEDVKYGLEKFSIEQKNSILLGLSSMVFTSSANIIYVSYTKKPKLSTILTINLIGGGVSLISFIKYINSYKYLKRYNNYKEATPLEEMKLK
jgi:hypothetical protein